MAAYHICRVSQDGIDRGLHGHQPAPPVGGLQVLLQVGVVVEGHPALVAHDVLRLQMHFVDVLREVRVLALAVGAFGLGDGCDDKKQMQIKSHLCSFMNNPHMLSEVAVLLPADRAR